MLRFFFISLMFTTGFGNAIAQQQTASPQEQAISAKLMSEINENLQLRAALIKAQQQNDTLKVGQKPADKPADPAATK